MVPVLLLLSLLVVLGLFLCMQTTAIDVRNENNLVVEVHCMEKERQALLNVKKGLVDPSNRLSSWVEEANCCRWRGVKCNNKTGHVVTLDLHNRYVMDNGEFSKRDDNTSLVGEISSSLLDLQYLQHLDLSFNNFNSNAIPEFFGSLVQLRSLNLSNTNFGGQIPHQIGNLSNLNYLDLNCLYLPVEALSLFVTNLDWLPRLHSLIYLDMTGTNFSSISWLVGITSNLGKLCNLQILKLHDSNLRGDIPDEFWSGCISNSLEDIDLSNNELHGHLPEDLGKLSSLRNLYLNRNRLNGSLPSSMGQLTHLVELDVSSNSLEGVISESHLRHLSKLRVLRLSRNSFRLNLSFDWTPPFQLDTAEFDSCLLGPRFPLWLRTQKNISRLDISNNGINDTIPSWFWNFSSNMNSMDLSSNHIYGKLPTLSLALLKRISQIDFSSNLLEGSIPGISPSTRLLILSNNSFSGTLSDLLCNVSNIPNSLYYLDLSENRLVGLIPDCLNYWRSVQFFNLKNNIFSGKIPNSIGYMDDLQSLHFNGNNFSGVLPLSLKNCTSLVVLDAGENMFFGEIPPWIGENLTQLNILRLHSNGFTGNIPYQLCQITNLQILDLAHNNLQGFIPRCFINLTWMSNIESGFASVFSAESAMVVLKGMELVYQTNIIFNKIIDLSSNSLFGEIPREMMNLTGLRSLNLSRNNLVGKIPGNIGLLSRLESLDFSRNHLSGDLPMSLTNLSFLGSLDLSFNNLSGTIPLSTQLQSFNASSYMENSGLCGPPLTANCTTNETSSQGPDHHSTKNEDGIDIPWFYIGMAMGYIVGFWVACGFLLFNRSWRNACFRYVEEVHDWFYVVLIINARKLQRKFGN